MHNFFIFKVDKLQGFVLIWKKDGKIIALGDDIINNVSTSFINLGDKNFGNIYKFVRTIVVKICR